jgi:hypothetical protein
MATECWVVQWQELGNRVFKVFDNRVHAISFIDLLGAEARATYELWQM